LSDKSAAAFLDLGIGYAIAANIALALLCHVTAFIQPYNRRTECGKTFIHLILNDPDDEVPTNKWRVTTVQSRRDSKVMAWNRRKQRDRRSCFLFRIEGYEKLLKHLSN
jgi:hypothetical protein